MGQFSSASEHKVKMYLKFIELNSLKVFEKCGLISISISDMTFTASGSRLDFFVPAENALYDKYLFAKPSAICDLHEFPVHRKRILSDMFTLVT